MVKLEDKDMNLESFVEAITDCILEKKMNEIKNLVNTTKTRDAGFKIALIEILISMLSLNNFPDFVTEIKITDITSSVDVTSTI